MLPPCLNEQPVNFTVKVVMTILLVPRNIYVLLATRHNCELHIVIDGHSPRFLSKTN